MTANLDDVCRWLIASQADPVRLEPEDLSSAGRSVKVRLARPITAPRGVLCGLWLIVDIDESECLLAGQLPFVAAPRLGRA